MEFLNFQNKRWNVKLKIPDTGLLSDKLEWFKWYRQADIILKKEGLLYFVEEIPEIEFKEICEKG